MKTRSVLVNFPGIPFSLAALLPNRQLASLAGCLLEAGHLTRIQDYGTLTLIDRLYPRQFGKAAGSLLRTVFDRAHQNPVTVLQSLWQSHCADRAFRERQEAVCQEVAAEIAAMAGLHFVVFSANDADDLAAAALISQKLKTMRPRIRVLLMGAYPALWGEIALERLSFDAVLDGENEMFAVDWAERIHEPESWHKVPGLIWRRNGRALRNNMASDETSALPPPTYSPDVYPALRSGGKIKLFTVEDSRGAQWPCHARPRTNGGVRMKSAHAVCDEIWRLGSVHGARVFHLTGASVSAMHTHAVAGAINDRRMSILYSRDGHVPFASETLFAMLRRSGCVSLSFNVPTGSQRLLDQQYGRDLGVSQIENALRTCRAAGLYTVTRLTYPSPEDDHQTLAETLRLLDRTRPDAALVTLPEILPFSTWFARAADFGFSVDARRLARKALTPRYRFPLPANRWRVLGYGIGRLTPGQVIQAHEELIQEIELRGIYSNVSEEMALLAGFSGYNGREGEFSRGIEHALLAGDLAKVDDVITNFNYKACVPSKALVCNRQAPVKAAAGNF